MHRTPFQLQMGIAPASPAQSMHIALSQVHASDKAHLAIHHYNLTVVAIVHFAGKKWEKHL